MRFLSHHAYLLLSVSVVAGCLTATGQAAAGESPAQSPAAVAIPVKANNTATRTPDLANPKVAAPQAAEFKPPFPERTELFEAPKRAQSTVRRDDEHGQTVELKGFVNVDEPSVVLSIDGVLSSVPAGGEKSGVQVISIQPPKAVLQRGRSRWTATLE